MKKYAYYKLGRVKPRTVIGYVNGCFPTFFHYCEEQNIYSLINYQESDMLDFVGYLKEEKHVSERTGYTMTSVLEELFRIGREKGWEVPREDVFALISSRDIWKRNRQYVKAY